jgi:hypothetical protein
MNYILHKFISEINNKSLSDIFNNFQETDDEFRTYLKWNIYDICNNHFPVDLTCKQLNNKSYETAIEKIRGSKTLTKWDKLYLKQHISFIQTLKESSFHTQKTKNLTQKQQLSYFINFSKYCFSLYKLRMFLLNVQRYIINERNHTYTTVSDLMDIIVKVQQTRKRLKRFVRMWKLKHAIKCPADTTFNLEPLSNFPDNQIFTFMENNTVYKTHVYDLLKIWKQSLLEHEYMFITPKFPSNPYTNIDFSYSTLWNLYIFAKSSNIAIDLVIHMFVKDNMDIHTFKINNEAYLQDVAIKNEINQLTFITKRPFNKLTNDDKKKLIDLFCVMVEIIKEFNILYLPITFYLRSVLMQNDLERKHAILKEFMPYIKQYYYFKYSLHPEKRNNIQHKLQHELNLFFAYSNELGRWYFETFNEEPECPVF